MDSVQASNTDTRMNEVSLMVMQTKLSTIRQLCAPCADGLDNALKHVDEITARSALGLLENMLFSLTQAERAQFERHSMKYREICYQDLVSNYTRAEDRAQFMGVDSEHLASVYEHLRYKEGAEVAVSNARIEFILRIAELCGFGLELLEQKRGHLRLVRPDEG